MDFVHRSWPLWLAMLVYLAQAWQYYQIKDTGMTISFVGYAVANTGFLLNLWRQVT